MDKLPVNSPTESFWHSEISAFADHRTTPELPSESDVVIIGSGFSAAAAVYHLLEKAENRPSTTILEARQVCSGATGRNGGHLKPFPFLGWTDNVKRYGPQAAAHMSTFQSQQLINTKKLIEKENIDCDFVLTRAFEVHTEVSHPSYREYLEMVKSGLVNCDGIHPLIGAVKAEGVSGLKGAKLAVSFPAASLWPYKLICHLLRRSIEMGANLQTHTPVLSISGKPTTDGRWIIDTPRGQIKAKKVIITANGYISSILPQFKDKIVPVRGFAVRIAVPEGKEAPHLDYTYTIKFGPHEYDYLLPRPDGSIIVGGAKQVVLKDEKHWYNTVDDSKMPPGTAEYFEGYMQRTFKGWEDSNARITHKWSGIMGYSSDMQPWVGELPGKKGLYVSAGFTGGGMSRILGCATALADLVRGDAQSLSDTNVPWPWWITQERLNSKVNLIREYMDGSSDSKTKL